MICRAAVKIYDRRQDKEVVIPCHRHCDAFQILHDFGYKKNVDFQELEQGFLDDHEEFLSRRDAWYEADKCSQIKTPPAWSSIRELYSEDLW